MPFKMLDPRAGDADTGRAMPVAPPRTLPTFPRLVEDVVARAAVVVPLTMLVEGVVGVRIVAPDLIEEARGVGVD